MISVKEQILTLFHQKLNVEEQKALLKELNTVHQTDSEQHYKDDLMNPVHLVISTYTPDGYGGGFALSHHRERGVKIHHKLLNIMVSADNDSQHRNKATCLMQLEQEILKRCTPFDLEKALNGQPILFVKEMRTYRLERDSVDDELYLALSSNGEPLNRFGYYIDDLRKHFKMCF